MSSWWPSGRYSPFAAYTSRGPPQVTQDDFTYLDSDRRPQIHQDHHEHYHPHHNSTQPATGSGRNNSYGFPKHSVHPDLDLDPDILVLKHKGTTYPLHFPAFSIAESLKVGELRRQAAKETKCDDPRRVKLLYKGRSLRDDSKSCREEGLKQNSEIMCVVSSEPSATTEDGNESSSSASSAAIANGVEAVHKVSRTAKGKTHKGGSGAKRRTNRMKHDDGTGAGGGGGDTGDNYLSPPNGGPSATDRSPSRDRPPTTTKPASPQPGATAAATPPPPIKKPTTPGEILQAVSDDFNTNFLPKVRLLLDHPPKSQKERDYESKKLSEGILTQVLFKLDGVQTEDEGMKARRKECVKLANFWSGELDKLQKKEGGGGGGGGGR